MSRLESQIRAHCAANKIAVPDPLNAAIEDHMCRHLPEGFCFGSTDGKPRARVVTLQQIKATTSQLAAGNPRVRIGLARARAAVCGACPNNDRTICPTCVGLVNWAQRLAGAKLGGVDDWLGVCAVDATALSAKVHMTNVPDNPAYPENCWKVKDVV